MNPLESDASKRQSSAKTAGRGSGRDSSGKFAAGGSGGPGRPRRLTREQLLDTLADAVTPEAIQEMVLGLIAQGKNGNVPAARLVLELGFGKNIPPLCDDPNVILIAMPKHIFDSAPASGSPESQSSHPPNNRRGNQQRPADSAPGRTPPPEKPCAAGSN